MKRDLSKFFNENPIYFLIFAYVIGGLFLLAAIFNWEWFFNNSRFAWLEKKMGRKGLRILYACAGFFMLLVGTLAILKEPLDCCAGFLLAGKL